MTTIRIAIRPFAAFREAIGESRLTLEVSPGVTPADVWSLLSERFPGLRAFSPPARFAVNDEFVDPDVALRPRDELALIPPVSGGGDGRPAPVIEIALTRGPIDIAAVAVFVDPHAGATVAFLGTVRDHARGRRVDYLEYEAYETLARREMARIAEEAAGRWSVTRIAIVHRLGRLEVGEASVAIAVSAPHREEAFAAGRFLIDTLKQTVPIWKKEVWGEGAEWIGSSARSES